MHEEVIWAEFTLANHNLKAFLEYQGYNDSSYWLDLNLSMDCLRSQQHAKGWIGLDKFMRCHTEVEIADWTCYLT